MEKNIIGATVLTNKTQEEIMADLRAQVLAQILVQLNGGKACNPALVQLVASTQALPAGLTAMEYVHYDGVPRGVLTLKHILENGEFKIEANFTPWKTK